MQLGDKFGIYWYCLFLHLSNRFFFPLCIQLCYLLRYIVAVPCGSVLCTASCLFLVFLLDYCLTIQTPPTMGLITALTFDQTLVKLFLCVSGLF